jgi:hypothetical protein
MKEEEQQSAQKKKKKEEVITGEDEEKVITGEGKAKKMSSETSDSYNAAMYLTVNSGMKIEQKKKLENILKKLNI